MAYDKIKFPAGDRITVSADGKLTVPDHPLITYIEGDGIGADITKAAMHIWNSAIQKAYSGKRSIAWTEVFAGEKATRIYGEGVWLPEETLQAIEECKISIKGPLTTPVGKGIRSLNVQLRQKLDLYVCLRPVRHFAGVPSPVKEPDKTDMVVFRENTEGAYAVGSMGVNVTDDLALDFVVTTSEGCDRIARLAYDYARRNNKGRVSIITKANVIKTTDGKFLNLCKKVGEEYPDIVTDEWYIDITTAKLIDEKRRRDFKVFILPNLYGDIITDEAAEFQGGVGTAGSANIGKRYAMFEAIHGSAPRMVREGRAQYADPCSMLRASVMLLSHIGEQEKADLLERALDICMYEDKKLKITGREDGCTCSEFGDYVMETVRKISE